MSSSPVRRVAVPTSMDRVFRQILSSFGWLHYEHDGASLLLFDGERRMKVDIDVRSDRDSNGEVVPDAVEFEFVGYTEHEADELIRQYLWSALLTKDGQASRLSNDWIDRDESFR